MTHSKAYSASEALRCYLSNQDWQVQSIKAATKKADTKGTKFVDHQEVVDWVNSWGSICESEMPMP
jgi:predicted transcriptional regulator